MKKNIQNTQQKPYHPPQKVLEKYAHVLVNFALNSGKGIKRGDVVRIVCPESAKPLYAELKKAVIKSGGHVIGNYVPDDIGMDDRPLNMSKDFFDYADESQVNFFPKKYLRAMADTIDHQISIISEANKHALHGVDPKKIMQSGRAVKPFRDWLTKKENAGKFTWTLGLYGTQAMADEANLSVQEYWDQIIRACYLDKKDPIIVWKKLYADMAVYEKKLNEITKKTEKFHIIGPDIDLWITPGEKRKFIGGSGRNIPSFELFTSPDWRGTQGWVKFNQPLYRYGNLITDIFLRFEKGLVVEATASKNQHVLREMIAVPGANKVGEWSLTDKRLSRITKFMAETLFDENMGGPQGNTHIAVGMSYHDCYDGDPTKVSSAGWKKLGFNDSSVHTDIISTTPRTVVAHTKDGKEIVIYKNGQFVF